MMTRIVCGLVLAGMLGFAPSARASSVLLNECGNALLCNQVRVTTSLVGSSVDVDITDEVGGPSVGIFGAAPPGANYSFAFNVVGATDGLNITDATSGFSLIAGPDNIGGGYGSFEFLISGPQQGANSTLPVHFRVSRTAGFSNDLQLWEPNSLGNIFAAHARIESDANFGVTAFVAVDDLPSTTTPVPEPASMLLLGSGLGAAALRRIRAKA